MATRLHALLGLLQGAKTNLKKPLDAAYHEFKRPPLFNGFSRTYRRLDEENGELFPEEGEIVQRNVEDVLLDVAPLWARVVDLQTTVDRTNQEAFGTIRIGEEVWDLPAVTLIWLDKQLTELHTLITNAPEVNPTKEWFADAATGGFRTGARVSIKTKKVPKALILAPGDGKFPAQVQAYNEDVTIGHWDTTDYSGATVPSRKREILDRISALRDQVKLALSTANDAEANDLKLGAELFAHLFHREA